MSPEDSQSNHDDALALFFEELLTAEESAERAAQSEPQAEAALESERRPEQQPELTPGVILPCGQVSPDDDRHYVCDVGGVGVAIPAIRVSAERPFDGTLSGAEREVIRTLALADGKTFPLVDLAALILPRSAPALKAPLAERIHSLVLLDDGQWMMAGTGEGKLQALDLDKMVWRGEQSSRPWLAGTLVESRLVLLDLDALVAMLP